MFFCLFVFGVLFSFKHKKIAIFLLENSYRKDQRRMLYKSFNCKCREIVTVSQNVSYNIPYVRILPYLLC